MTLWQLVTTWKKRLSTRASMQRISSKPSLSKRSSRLTKIEPKETAKRLNVNTVVFGLSQLHQNYTQ